MNKGLLKKLLQSNLSKEEAEMLSAWLQDDSSDDFFSKEFDQMFLEDIDVEAEEYPEWKSEELKLKVLQQIRSLDSLHRKGENAAKRRTLDVNRFFKYAVAATVSLLLGFYFYTSQLQSDAPAAGKVQWVSKANPSGKKTIIHLSDGSKVYLNAESSIRYPENFKSDRSIILEGEAFFEVAEDTLHPFRVEAGALLTTALGTSFNIRTFPEEDKVFLALVSGKVKTEVSGTGNEAYLLPGQGTSLDKNSQEIQLPYQANLDQVLFWKEGVLHFEQVSFLDLITRLERWYGVDVTVKGDYPKSGTFSGTFKNNENLTNVLQTIQFAEEFSFESEGKQVLIQF
ncbi:FecR family protein [Cyclobacterium lianum]|uniref:FecR family protein n=1 Tax=Cyclobacterium lianum TaxID=388280 RepID=A0A1M7PAA1_9BACT|nr:FecR family protein [Cyclobacterium lianum]SHN13661.1 FecR family protein [Cyclobacterium lianum]